MDYGLKPYKWKSQGYSSILELLNEGYRQEGLRMYTMEDFQKEARQTILDEMTPAQIGEAIPAKKLAEVLRQKYSRAEINRLLDQR